MVRVVAIVPVSRIAVCQVAPAFVVYSMRYPVILMGEPSNALGVFHDSSILAGVVPEPVRYILTGVARGVTGKRSDRALIPVSPITTADAKYVTPLVITVDD